MRWEKRSPYKYNPHVYGREYKQEYCRRAADAPRKRASMHRRRESYPTSNQDPPTVRHARTIKLYNFSGIL